MRHIRAICFDLDDTLWDLSQVIPLAERRLHEWFRRHYPRVADNYSTEGLHQLRRQIGARYPELHHDLSKLRMLMLQEVLRSSGYATEPAAEAFAVFQQARNEVTLYADVIPVLRQLAQTHQLYALTNGNASLESIGISKWFKAAFSAGELGVAKPDANFFHSAMRTARLQPAQTLHVGDSPENDIRPAQAAGMTTLWLNRDIRSWNLPDCEPDHELPNLELLPDLLRSP